MKKIKRLKKSIFHQAIWITTFSAVTFIIPTIIHAYIRSRYELSFEANQLRDIIYSLMVIFLNIFIVKKWFSFNEVGLQKKGFIKSLFYSIIFVVLLRLFDYFSLKQAFPKEIWTWRFVFSLMPNIFLAFQEELMFRGIIFRVWEKWKGFLVALFMSSILFGVEHLVYPVLGSEAVTTSKAVSTALWGPIFVTIAYRTNNIWGLTISHFLYNASILSSEQKTHFKILFSH